MDSAVRPSSENAMKLALLVFCCVGSILASNPALAQALSADDIKWINQCISDNKGGASAAVIRNHTRTHNKPAQS
jgi:hypothetical protein